jgi:hypothetical protein
MSALSRELAASVLVVEARKEADLSRRLLTEVTAELLCVMRERDLLEARLRILEAKLERRRDVQLQIVGGELPAFLRPQAE